MYIFNKYLILLLAIISADSSAQNYLPEETPLDVKICDFVDINGSVDQTSLIALVPKLTMKSGTLSACGINQAVGDISGNTKLGITKMGSGEPEYIRKHCEEIACRAQHAHLINESAREVVKLIKSHLKISNNNYVTYGICSKDNPLLGKTIDDIQEPLISSIKYHFFMNLPLEL